MSFRIYYADGSFYDKDPFGAPALGVLVIVESDNDHGRRIVAGKDYYVWDCKNCRWWTVDYPGMIDYLTQTGPRRILIGRTVPNDEWYAAFKRADEDPDFAERTGWGPDECSP